MSAPSFLSASTSTVIGRCFIRSVPVMVCCPSVVLSRAVRKRMAVPAAPMSITSGILLRAARITSVSSQCDRFSGVVAPPERAWIIKARLLMLFEAGRLMSASTLFGAVMRYVMLLAINICVSGSKFTFFISMGEKYAPKFANIPRTHYLCARKQTVSGFSAVGSAHVWGARGRWFESSNPDQEKAQELAIKLLEPSFFVYGLRHTCWQCMIFSSKPLDKWVPLVLPLHRRPCLARCFHFLCLTI